jgi:hypothetical protein
MTRLSALSRSAIRTILDPLAILAVCLGAASIVGLGCGGGDGPVANCPNDLPPACPTPAPGFAADVFPAIQARCAGCHSPTGIEANRPYQTYQQIFSQRAGMLHQLYTCRMPPATAPQPTAEERQLLLTWLVCGAPDN